MTDDPKNEPRHWFDERDLKYINAEEDPRRREAMVCAVTTYRRRDKLNEGDPIPALQLAELENDRVVDLSGSRDKPLVLIFGSYT